MNILLKQRCLRSFRDLVLFAHLKDEEIETKKDAICPKPFSEFVAGPVP